ncbi:MAG: DUF2811 domain-containing protein [Gomphosphaeria aponina SAG 52.96 = DSM 107014]|uniref:DUF2811 domain-containing protein n=1 Tax=Gomphosphaeria aponina SAG 52.96 = DSM 107014 TaxID=1521640 RepID=A0A941GUT0_9CHRO|nr:DUF2811 domain-containing protein [Gomphosphaeria aponina SAG 52.96 = DSM 107014]
MTHSVSILAEIPEELHESLKNYLETHPNWDYDSVFAAALSFFLLQNGEKNKINNASQNNRVCAQVYLETLFRQS